LLAAVVLARPYLVILDPLIWLARSGARGGKGGDDGGGGGGGGSGASCVRVHLCCRVGQGGRFIRFLLDNTDTRGSAPHGLADDRPDHSGFFELFYAISQRQWGVPGWAVTFTNVYRDSRRSHGEPGMVGASDWHARVRLALARHRRRRSSTS